MMLCEVVMKVKGNYQMTLYVCGLQYTRANKLERSNETNF